jgi:hypothetical protein
MPTIELDAIDSEVEALIRRLATQEGGLIAIHYHQTDLDIALDANSRMLHAFKAFVWGRESGIQQAGPSL